MSFASNHNFCKNDNSNLQSSDQSTTEPDEMLVVGPTKRQIFDQYRRESQTQSLAIEARNQWTNDIPKFLCCLSSCVEKGLVFQKKKGSVKSYITVR